MKGTDSLFLILPKTYYGLSEFSEDHFIYFLRFLLTKLFYIWFVLLFNSVLKKPMTPFSFELRRCQKSLVGM